MNYENTLLHCTECELLYHTATLLFLALVRYYVQSYSVHKLRYFVPKRMDKLRDNRPKISLPREKTNNASSTSKANMYVLGKIVAVPKKQLSSLISRLFTAPLITSINLKVI